MWSALSRCCSPAGIRLWRAAAAAAAPGVFVSPEDTDQGFFLIKETRVSILRTGNFLVFLKVGANRGSVWVK